MKKEYILPVLLLLVVAMEPVYAGGGPSAAELNRSGMSALDSGNNSAAAAYFIQAIAIDPSVKYYYNNLAAAYMRMGDYYAAEKQLLIALGIDPGYTRALSNMSVVLFRTGRYSESYRYYLLAKQSDPSYAEKRFEKRRVLEKLKRLSAENPGDQDLKRIINHIESSGE